MKLWLTAQEIADAALPDLPTTKRNVNAFAERNGWRQYPAKARRRPGAEGGGGVEYHIDLLPAWARLAYLRRHAAVDVPAAADAMPNDAASESPAAIGHDARLQLVRLADQFHRGSGLALIASDAEFAGLYNGGSMPVAGWVRGAVASISVRTLARWRAAAKAGAALATDRGASRKGTGVLDRAEDGKVRSFALALLAKNRLFAAKHVRAAAADRFPSVAGVPMRTWQHALKLWRREYRHELTLLTDPDGYRNSVRFVATGATRAERLNELWQIDASPADVMTHDGRQSIYVAIDVWSRRLAILVAATPRAEAVGLLLRKCILAWGVPEAVKSDNGSDFTARWTSRLLASLGIVHDTAKPFSPEQKGIVERAIGTVQRDLMTTLPGFVGHNVADRRRIEAKTAFSRRLGANEETLFGVDLTAGELAEAADGWANEVYAHAPHAGLRGATPFARAAAWTGPVRRIEDTAALDVLLARVPGKDGIRRVTRSGIRIDGSHYLITSVMPGEDVLCRMDAADLGRLHVFTPDGDKFLGHALAPELAGLDPGETIARVRAAQRALMDGRLADIRREAKQIRPRDVAAAIRRQAGAQNAALLAFPRPAETHATPAIAAAGDAAVEIAATPLTGRAAEIHAELLAEAEAPASPINVTPLRREETMQQRFRRAIDLQQRVERGEALETDEAMWLGGYRAGPEFRAMSLMHEDFERGRIELTS